MADGFQSQVLSLKTIYSNNCNLPQPQTCHSCHLPSAEITLSTRGSHLSDHLTDSSKLKKCHFCSLHGIKSSLVKTDKQRVSEQMRHFTNHLCWRVTDAPLKSNHLIGSCWSLGDMAHF